MTDKRCFVQFSHPGAEAGPRVGRDWNTWCRGHRRKFLDLEGKWQGKDSVTIKGNLWAWAEWEPESTLKRRLYVSDENSLEPRNLWSPYYRDKEDYWALHNTDPFIFGKRFLYSNCGQIATSKGGLKHLAPGSVIAFGSSKKILGEWQWRLDTLFVVKDYIDYGASNLISKARDRVPQAFLDVTGQPLIATRKGQSCLSTCDPQFNENACPIGDSRLRLYRGVTPQDSKRLFSFFPATPAVGESGFARPIIELPSEYFNPANIRSPKGISRELPTDEIECLWDCLVKQVFDQGLVLGTYAACPPKM